MLCNDSVFQVLQNETLIHLDVSSGQISYYNAQPHRENKKRGKRSAETKESTKRRCINSSTPKVIIDLDPTPNNEESTKSDSSSSNNTDEIEVILETTVPESNELPAVGSSVWFLEIEHLLKQNEQPSPSPSPVKSSKKTAKPTQRRNKNSKRQLFGVPSSISASPPLSPTSSAPVLISPSSPTRFDSIPSFAALGSSFDEELKRKSLAGVFDSLAQVNSLPSLPPLGNLYSSLASLNMLSNPAAFSALSAQSSLYPLFASPFGLPSYPFVSPFYYGPSLMYFNNNNFQASQ
eukprot:TRINITY_DN109_c0_g1_i1.p1 TRINITY_DN109_c0_g1~~TRINITY_DN109_c0_g1_i1.p1  ORF type:complete len:292 (+),score=71.15 TRINITY_DN109_c0_g1_i1:322-1197(+)